MKYIETSKPAMIAQNVENILQRVAFTCTKAGRKPEEVTLIGVAKTFTSEAVGELVHAGVLDVGENYVQELQEKHRALNDERIRWHFIGHLQSNKVKNIAPWIHMIHAVDSVSLGEEISKRAEQSGRVIPILIEVNTTGEQSKFGAAPEAVMGLAKDLMRFPHINVTGLMTIGPFLPDPEQSRPAFRMLNELRQHLRQDGFTLPHLSMGMTNDFEVAIEEGATLVRVGTAIFGKRIKHNSTISGQ